MKRTLLTFAILLTSLTAMAQIVLVPGKFTSADGKGFVVVEHEGTQAELFDKVRAKIVSLYNDPKSVISENKPNIITINGMSSGITFKMLGQTFHPLIHYKLNIYFKDGKIRFNAPIVIGAIKDETRLQGEYSIFAMKQGMMSNVYPVYKKNGDVRNEELKASMEEYFNLLIASLTKDLDNPNGGIPEDW